MKEKLFFAFIVFAAYASWSQIYLTHYGETGMPYGKSDITHYIMNAKLYSQFGDVHFMYMQVSRGLSDLLSIPYPMFLSYFVPFTGTVLLGLVLWHSFRCFPPGERLFCALALFTGSYLMFVNNTVCVLAQFMSVLFFYLSMPYMVDKKFLNPWFLVFAGFSVGFHSYSLLLFLFVYGLSCKRWWLILVFIVVLGVLMRPNNLIQFTFFSDHYNETSPYEHVFYFINPYILGFSVLCAFRCHEPYLKRLFWGLFFIGFVSHISRALPFFLWIMAYMIFRVGFRADKRLYWLFVFSSLVWLDHLAFLFARSL